MPHEPQISVTPVGAVTINTPPTDRPFRSVNIRRVPMDIWRHARLNALMSQMPFRDYCIRLLASGTAISNEQAATPRA